MGKHICGWMVMVTLAYTFGAERAEARSNELAHGAAVLVLDPSGECALGLQGTGSGLIINGGQLRVNSSARCAVCDNGNPSIDVNHMFVVGGSCFSGDLTGQLSEGAAPRADPLANVPEPSSTGPLRTVPGGPNITLLPGWYPVGIHKNNVTINLVPGVYYIGGSAPTQTGGFSMTGTLNGNGVMIFLKSGGIDLDTIITASLSPLNPVDYPSINGSDTYEHVLVFQSRANTTIASLQGFPPSVTGTLYFPSNALSVIGGAGNLGSQVICRRLEVAGNGDVIVNYNGAFPGPPCDADCNDSMIVDIDDLLTVISAWGPCKESPCEGNVVVADGEVNIDDLLAVIAAWGVCP